MTSGITLEAQSAVIRETTIRYWLSGDATAEPMLVLHGLGGDHRGLAELTAAIPNVRIIAVDLPGYGESTELTERHSLTNYARIIEDLRVHLGLAHFHLLGHSLGASISLVYAARFGVHLKSLYLLNPVSTANNITAQLGKLYYRFGAWLPDRLARWWLASKPAVYLSDAFVINTQDRQRRREILRQDYENYRRASIRAMVEGFLSYGDTSFTEYASTISCPVLLITGDRDSIAPAPAVTELCELMGAGRLAVVPGAGHLVPVECPGEIAGLVNTFLHNSSR